MSDISYIFELKRFRFLPDVTNGRLYLPEGTRFCDSLEDTDRDLNMNGELEEGKVYGKTAIPYGIYPMVFRHSPKFNRMMLYIDNIKTHQGVMFHWGSSIKDTLGCVIIGVLQSPHIIVNTRNTVEEFEKVVAQYQSDGSETLLQITKAE